MAEKQKKRSAYWIFIISLAALTAVCALLSQSTAFCDFYADYIFGVELHIFGRLSGVFPFSLGELLIVLAALLVLLQLIFPLLLLALRGRRRFRRFVIRYSKCMLAASLLTAFLITMNCSTLYHCSRMELGEGKAGTDQAEELRALRDYIAERCNTLAEKMNRDENGDVVTSGDIDGKIREAMARLSADFPRLSGYYPDPKPIFGSLFMYQAGYDGVYFPFSLEANYNTYISDIRYPHVACHELAHLKGYIYEDEADFIAYLACVGSDDEELQYAGYLGVLNYVDADYRHSARGEDETPLPISDRVRSDAASYTSSTYEKLSEKKKLIDTEVVATASKGFTDAYMDYYGAEPNYAEVTKLLLAYYRNPDHNK